MDEQFEIEARGAAARINPMFGEWRQRFDIEPVSYSNPGPARMAFKQAVREQLKEKFIFVGQVALTITLFLDEQKMLETPAYGDLDNYAKQLLDTFKGNGGLVVDDCQVQRLDISWIDVPYSAYFEVEFRSGPDDFMPLPIKLYEMPDGLFYPISELVWTNDGIVAAPEGSVLAIAQTIAAMTSATRSLRHQLRLKSIPQFRAFQCGMYLSPAVMGFHRSRVVDSGYELVERRAWTPKSEMRA
ncbi:MAG: RusA family crossover junction endodeoxyribonuclease [Deltaproteobacteria bacterium]|nr:RusA family crossover junction endodeoxyribonuclease [Deltaproteobacteria bacterium]